MINQEDGSGPNRPRQASARNSWARFVHYVAQKANERKANNDKESPSERSARITADATLAIARFTIVLALCSAITILVLAQQLSEQRSQFQTSQRAWLEIAQPSIPYISVTDNAVSANLEVAYKNIGNLPASKVWINSQMVLGSGNASLAEAIAKQREMCDSKSYQPFGPVQAILPNETKVLKDGFEQGTSGHVIAGSRINPYIVGCILYKTPDSPEVRHTGFILEMVPEENRDGKIGIPAFADTNVILSDSASGEARSD